MEISTDRRIESSIPPLDTPATTRVELVPGVPELVPLTVDDDAALVTQPVIMVRTDPSPMRYVDGFVIPVPASQKEAYQELARMAAEVFKEYGATRVVECWGDDIPLGDAHDFKQAAKATDDEVVVFSWIEYPSKRVRDDANEKVRVDPRMKMDDALIPFDAKRMVFGGFAPILDTHAQPG